MEAAKNQEEEEEEEYKAKKKTKHLKINFTSHKT